MLQNLIELFLSFLKVGSFSFGGAYSLIPLIEREVVENNTWLNHEEFIRVLGMVEVFPGAISIKFATYTGYKVAGVIGVVAANLGNLVAPAVVIMLASYFYTQFEKNVYVQKAFTGVKFAIVGMIAAIMYKYAVKNSLDLMSLLFLVLGASLIFLFNLHPAYVVIISAVAALIVL
jgi:chromate transporter